MYRSFASTFKRVCRGDTAKLCSKQTLLCRSGNFQSNLVGKPHPHPTPPQPAMIRFQEKKKSKKKKLTRREWKAVWLFYLFKSHQNNALGRTGEAPAPIHQLTCLKTEVCSDRSCHRMPSSYPSSALLLWSSPLCTDGGHASRRAPMPISLNQDLLS